MTGLVSWIKGHQIISFFIITFAITWGLGFSYGALLNKGIYLLAPVAFIATCGPALGRSDRPAGAAPTTEATR